jgi:hypothetical protein
LAKLALEQALVVKRRRGRWRRPLSTAPAPSARRATRQRDFNSFRQWNLTKCPRRRAARPRSP